MPTTPSKASILRVADPAGAAADVQAHAVQRGNHSGTQSTATITGLDAALTAKADLVGGKLPTSQLPALAISEFLGSVASQAAMLALVGERGDWCLRSDLSAAFVLIADTPSLTGSWQQILTPGSPVTSVNGQVGAVVLGASNVGASAIGHNHIIANTTGLQAALDGKDTNLTTHAALVTTHGISAYGATLVDDVDATTARATLGLGTSATLNVGTSANQIVQLTAASKLPAVDGSLLTNLPASGETVVKAVNMTDTTIAGTNAIFVPWVGVNLTVGVWDIVPQFQHNNLLGTNVTLRLENTISGGADFSGLQGDTAGLGFNGTNTVVGNSVMTKGILDVTLTSLSIHNRASTGNHAFGGRILIEVTRAGTVNLSYAVTGTAAASITIKGGAIVCRKF